MNFMKKQLQVRNWLSNFNLPLNEIDFLLVSCKYKRRNCRNDWTPILTLYGYFYKHTYDLHMKNISNIFCEIKNIYYYSKSLQDVWPVCFRWQWRFDSFVFKFCENGIKFYWIFLKIRRNQFSAPYKWYLHIIKLIGRMVGVTTWMAFQFFTSRIWND